MQQASYVSQISAEKKQYKFIFKIKHLAFFMQKDVF